MTPDEETALLLRVAKLEQDMMFDGPFKRRTSPDEEREAVALVEQAIMRPIPTAWVNHGSEYNIYRTLALRGIEWFREYMTKQCCENAMRWARQEKFKHPQARWDAWEKYIEQRQQDLAKVPNQELVGFVSPKCVDGLPDINEQRNLQVRALLGKR